MSSLARPSRIAATRFAHDIERHEIIDRTVADRPFDGRSKAGDLFGGAHHVRFGQWSRAANPSTAVDRKRAASISVVLAENRSLPLFLFPAFGNYGRQTTREAQSNLPLAFARSLCYLGVFVVLGCCLGSLLSSKKLACGCGGIGRRTTLRW